MASTTTVTVNGGTPLAVTSGVPVQIVDNMFTNISNNPFIALNNVVITDTDTNDIPKSVTKYIGYNVHKLMLCGMTPASSNMTINSAVKLSSLISSANVGIYPPVRLTSNGTPETLTMNLNMLKDGEAILESIINKDYLKFGVVASYNSSLKYFWPVTISPHPKVGANIEPWAAYSAIGSAPVSPGITRYQQSPFYSYSIDFGDSDLSAIYSAITSNTSVRFSLVAYVAEGAASAGSTVPDSAAYLGKYLANASNTVSALKPTTVNGNTITVANSDGNNKDYYDGEGVGYGWVGTYDGSTTNDESITVTVTEA